MRDRDRYSRRTGTKPGQVQVPLRDNHRNLVDSILDDFTFQAGDEKVWLRKGMGGHRAHETVHRYK